MKYIVVNGSYRPDDNHASMISTYDDFESAKNCCNENIAEDFGYDSYDEFIKSEFPVCYDDDFGVVYRISYDVFEHQEEYKVYELR